MRATICLFAVAVLAALCTGCSAIRAYNPVLPWKAPVVPPGGIIYTHYKAPLTGDVSKVQVGDKTGTATTRYVVIPYSRLLSAGWADASIEEAAKQGGLTTVEFADYEGLSVLGVYGELTVTVHGK